MRKGAMAAESRQAGTKGSVHRLRREGRIPGIVYGGGAAPVAVSVGERDLQTALRTGVRVLDLQFGADSVQAVLKDVDYDHLGDRLIHVDFQRIVQGASIELRVPLVFRGTPVGLKDGGVFNVLHDTLLISCQPEDMPDPIEIDVAALAMGQSVHVREIALPPGVKAVEEGDSVVAVVTYSDKEIEVVAAVPEEAVATQPEVIGEAERKAAEEAAATAEAAAGGGKKEAKEAKKEEKK